MSRLLMGCPNRSVLPHSSQNSNNNSIKRERDTSEIYGEDSYDYSDEEDYEPAKQRIKEA